jgi:hypothetical protein
MQLLLIWHVSVNICAWMDGLTSKVNWHHSPQHLLDQLQARFTQANARNFDTQCHKVTVSIQINRLSVETLPPVVKPRVCARLAARYSVKSIQATGHDSKHGDFDTGSHAARTQACNSNPNQTAGSRRHRQSALPHPWGLVVAKPTCSKTCQDAST